MDRNHSGRWFYLNYFLYMVCGGVLLSMMGVLGLYIGKIFDQVKGRQLFIVRDKLNFDQE